MAVKDLSRRWSQATRALRADEQKYGSEIVRMVQQHSSEGFCAFDDPLESAVFSVLVEILKERDRHDRCSRCSRDDREHVDP
ncbi:MAG TPA: hypothetical protein P5217_03775 [Methanoregulaceae archaeon]|nr:hypothetical protein [Methanoregulaceae archaeon]HRY75381.1 hypothetical protein [Methanoregulaceae archaeon]